MLVSTIIPIPKSTKKSLNDSSNYRGIALSSVIGKVFDLLILNTNREVLKSRVTQFGFKEKHFTSQSTTRTKSFPFHWNKFVATFCQGPSGISCCSNGPLC